ncbi:hypothetical protein EH196_07180 [Bacillus sp. C1-1]|uniref:Uncharacterized protein n=1 Tax=Shouchella lehensis TaxID=300825 RepID=A0A4Y7WJY7_9BACI|nr:hypothetical protein [Shouchella lehensis]RQW21463.1 hypothetical protein EH196_07180 [Bacillus sp. C1-1]TES48534.1 hypothetical protein E2L03_13270 [Shouchella lehensis]
MNTYKKLSWICILLSILVWIPNVVFQVASPLWLSVYIFGTVGTVFGVFAKSYLLVILNVIMFFSFFILMAVFSLYEAYYG